MAGKDPRGKLLDAAIDHIAARGISDLSLRELAAAIGTSHRMLIHHFGSREGLWVEVIRAVEERQRALLAEVVPDPEAGGRRRHAPVVAPHLRPVAVGQRAAVLRGLRPGAAGPRRARSSCSTGSSTAGSSRRPQGFVAYGLAREEALAQARLGLAVSRGLLLDLLATGDRDGRRRRDGGLHRARRGKTGRIFRSPSAGPTLESAHTTRRGHRRAGRACAAGPGTRGAAGRSSTCASRPARSRRRRPPARSSGASATRRSWSSTRSPARRACWRGWTARSAAPAVGLRGGRRAALRARQPRRARPRAKPIWTPCARRSTETVDGITSVRWRQAVDGIAAADSELRVNLDGDGRVLNVLGSPASGLDVDTTPALTAGEAVRVVQDDVGVYRALPRTERHARR